MNLKTVFLPLAALCTAFLLTGISECDPDNPTQGFEELLDPSLVEPPKAAVSIHNIIRYPRGNESERLIPSYFGKDVTVEALPLLFAKEITDIVAIPQVKDPNFYDLKLKLNSRGRKRWIGLSVLSRQEKKDVAFVIDGMYYRSFTPRLIYDDTTEEVIIDGPFDKATALELQANAAKNFKKKSKN